MFQRLRRSQVRDDIGGSRDAALMGAPATEQTRQLAIDRLKAMHESRKLHPVPDWQVHEGSVLDAYLDILGLNGRLMRDS